MCTGMDDDSQPMPGPSRHQVPIADNACAVFQNESLSLLPRHRTTDRLHAPTVRERFGSQYQVWSHLSVELGELPHIGALFWANALLRDCLWVRIGVSARKISSRVYVLKPSPSKICRALAAVWHVGKDALETPLSRHRHDVVQQAVPDCRCVFPHVKAITQVAARCSGRTSRVVSVAAQPGQSPAVVCRPPDARSISGSMNLPYPRSVATSVRTTPVAVNVSVTRSGISEVICFCSRASSHSLCR